LVATGPDDERFFLPEFVKATAIYPNQDVKCKVARQRAVDWAASEGKQISWVYARDAARHGALQKRPYTSADKVRWLGYHDKACADMPGWLPLAAGMPAVLTDHLDRGEKQLLRGCHATIHAWVVDEDEGAVADAAEVTLRRMPRQIVLDFQTDAWTLTKHAGAWLVSDCAETAGLVLGRVPKEDCVGGSAEAVSDIAGPGKHCARGAGPIPGRCHRRFAGGSKCELDVELRGNHPREDP